MAKRRKLLLTTTWLENWRPTRIEEVADKGCKGLVVRAGPSGVKTFVRGRTRVRIGHWPATSLADAQAAMTKWREERRAEVPGAALTVAQLAEAYRTDVLAPNRKSADATWKLIRQHVLEVRPDPKRPPFGEWAASMVKAKDCADVVRLAKVKRAAGKRTRGGLGTARETLRELKAIFAHGVNTGSLAATPAGTLQAPAFGIRKRALGDKWLHAEEVRALFDALDLTALLAGTAKQRKLPAVTRLALAFQLYVPLRSHSLIGARWKEVDLEAARWTVPVERLKLHKRDVVKARPFVVPLPETAVTILRRLKAQAGASPWVLASPRRPERPLGAKVLLRALTRLQADDRLALGWKLTVHDLRRTWRSYAMDLGVDHAVARLSLGHAGLEGVEGVYGRAQMVEQRAQAAELVAAAFDRIRLGQQAAVVPMAEARAEGPAARA